MKLVNSRLLNGDPQTPSMRSRRRASGVGPRPFTRENTVRARVNRMETLLANLNASITAMERGISPEEAQAQSSSPPPTSVPESGPMLVRDLATFVERLADGIERFPVRFWKY